MDDLKRNTVYGGAYDENHVVVQGFWKVCHSNLSETHQSKSPHQVVELFDQTQRHSLLRFVTSCSRPPLLYAFALLL